MIEIPSTAAGGEPLGDGAAEDPTRGRSQLLAAGWLQLVLEALTRIYHPDERTLKKLARNAAWMFKYFQRRGITQWCEITGEITLEWCWAGVRGADGAFREASASTARNRQWMAQTTFAAAAHLGAQIADPHAAAGPKIKRQSPAAQAGPVTDQELRRIRGHADPGGRPSRRSVAVALFSTGASALEASKVRAKDVDLEAKTVKFSGPRARVCSLDGLSVQTLARFLRSNPTAADERLCVKATTPPEVAAQAVSTQLCSAINQAGFANDPEISARSIRLTAARQVLERDGIEAAARFLGSPSLDHTAEALAHDWRHSAVVEPLGRGRQTIAKPPDDNPDAGGRDG